MMISCFFFFNVAHEPHQSLAGKSLSENVAKSVATVMASNPNIDSLAIQCTSKYRDAN